MTDPTPEQVAFAFADWMIDCRGNSYDRQQLRDAVKTILREHSAPITSRREGAANLKRLLRLKESLEDLMEFCLGESPTAVLRELLAAHKRVLCEIEHNTLAILNPLTETRP